VPDRGLQRFRRSLAKNDRRGIAGQEMYEGEENNGQAE
jgi:hypothetical protein